MAEKSEDSKVFAISQDRFHCITVDTLKHYKEGDSDDVFRQKLIASMKIWIEEGVRGVWVKASKFHTNLVSICHEVGLEIHHAQKNYVMLRKWISKEVETWPGYANHFLGCGGFVVNEKNQLLVIEEKWATHKYWKLPGGHAEPGEDIGVAVCREVREETGIDTEFRGIINFRHQHNYMFGCSDFYFVCLLKPTTRRISMCRNEIARCTWMDINEFVNNPDTTDTNKYFAQTYLKLKSVGAPFIMGDPVLSYRKDCFQLIYGPPIPKEDRK